jgi:hypothetical protein
MIGMIAANPELPNQAGIGGRHRMESEIWQWNVLRRSRS